MTDQRGALCLQCRTALAPGEACDVSSKHQVVRLDQRDERARAVDEVWGPPHLRAKKAAAVGGTSGAGAGVFEACQACQGCEGLSAGGEAAAVILVIVIVAFAAIALWWITTRIVHYVRTRRARVRPRAAERLPRHGGGLTGVIASATGDTSPGAGELCAAWGIVLRHSDAIGGDVMLRDGGSNGLEITLDDGRKLSIPAGRLRLAGDADKLDSGLAQLARVDPGGVVDDHPPIPCDRAEEVVVRTGDRVEVLGPVETRPDPTAAPGGYRESAAMLLVPARVAWLKKL